MLLVSLCASLSFCKLLKTEYDIYQQPFTKSDRLTELTQSVNNVFIVVNVLQLTHLLCDINSV